MLAPYSINQIFFLFLQQLDYLSYPSLLYLDDYYLQNKYPEYGTNIDNKCILPAVENTCMIMNGKIPHSIVNMPKEVAEINKRYSIVINYNVQTK